ncbi:hypothetical protein [Kineococcus rubinsiae]|uniref:hypothetical protein n=1 Tax=Kineococcus rubinsiae TaxID=2609562 RepID=UPI00142FDAA6|nr:hypothetical protein [Kineococcus rubinsiae]NIZ92795.1 hypothetical protein [Kineococcus rubinsiae]
MRQARRAARLVALLAVTASLAACAGAPRPPAPAVATPSPAAPSLAAFWADHPDQAPPPARDGSARLVLDTAGTGEEVVRLPDLTGDTGLVVSVSCTGPAAGSPSVVELGTVGEPALVSDRTDTCPGPEAAGHLDLPVLPGQALTQVRIRTGSGAPWSLAVYAVSSAYASTLTLTFDAPPS